MITKEDMYLDYVNNFLTLKSFAEYYGLTVFEAEALIREVETKLDSKEAIR